MALLTHQYIKKQLVIEGANVSEDDKAYLIDVKKQQTLAKEGKTRKLPLFVGEKEGKAFYIAPIRGKGLWDAIWGYVAMDKDMVIQGVFFDHKGETPGLGANIKQRFFMDDFSRKYTIWTAVLREAELPSHIFFFVFGYSCVMIKQIAIIGTW